MSIHSLMNTTVTIQQEVSAKSAAGFVSRTGWSDIPNGTDIPARVHDLSMSALAYYGRLGISATNMIYFDADPGLDGIEVQTRILWGNKIYYVQNTKNAGGNINRVWEVLVELDKTGTSP